MTDSPDPLTQARQLFLAGIEHFGAARFAAAEEAFAAALNLVPGRPSVLGNLGIAKVQLDKFAEALPLLQAALAGDDNQPDAWRALAIAQMELGRHTDALESLASARDSGVDPLVVQLLTAQCHARRGARDEGIALYRAVLAAHPELHEAWTELGHVLREARRHDEAAAAYREARTRGGDATTLDYFLGALQPQADAPLPEAPRAYVEKLFDDYAGDFDDHLVNQLGYTGHRLLVERLPAAAPARFARVLDAGCGTGLIGPLIRPRADELIGMDLSAGMLEKARARGIYDQLDQGDLVDYLARPHAPYDLVLVADVFVYIGALDTVFQLLAERLVPGGWLAFTVEESKAEGGNGVELLPSLRYAHRPDYLRRLAGAHGFEWVDSLAMALRYDRKQGIEGLCVFLRKT